MCRDHNRTDIGRGHAKSTGRANVGWLLAAAGVLLASGPASAQVSPPRAASSAPATIAIADTEAIAKAAPGGAGRFAMTPVEGGFLRMDTDTGTVSLCAKKPAGWTCETVADDYKALQKDADRLTKENEALKRELAELRKDAPSGVPQGKDDRKIELPSEEDVDKAIGQVEKYLKKFRGLIEKYQSPDGPPGRT